MESLIHYLESYDPKPKFAQLANGGNWEQAVLVDFASDAGYSMVSLDTSDSSIAGEVFYELNDGRTVFFGIRYTNDLKTSTPKDFLEKFLNILGLVPISSVTQVLSELGKKLTNDPSTFIDAAVTFVELGVEGYWKSAGSKVLRKSGEPSILKEDIQRVLTNNENLLRNSKNHTAIEFAVASPEFWFGIQVSKEENGEYITNLDSVVTLSNMI